MAGSNAFSQYPDCMSFLGFTYGTIHSSKFGLYRITSSDRYTVDLIPTSETKTIHVPGQEGSYFFGTEYKQKTFPIDVAFDQMTEYDLHMLKGWLTGGIQPLVFDETPYKAYYAKPDGGQNLNIVCYDEEFIDAWNKKNSRTVYKGEGVINFTCYSPFAHSTYKFLKDFPNMNQGESYSRIPAKFNSDWDIDEWKKEVNLLPSKEITDKNGNTIKYDTTVYDNSYPKRAYYFWYNPGDFNSYPLITLKISTSSQFEGFKLRDYYKDTGKTLSNSDLEFLNKDNFKAIGGSTTYYYFEIDTRSKNISMWNNIETEKKPCNKYIVSWSNKENGFEMFKGKTNYQNFIQLDVLGSPSSFSIECKYRYYYR